MLIYSPTPHSHSPLRWEKSKPHFVQLVKVELKITQGERGEKKKIKSGHQHTQRKLICINVYRKAKCYIIHHHRLSQAPHPAGGGRQKRWHVLKATLRCRVFFSNSGLRWHNWWLHEAAMGAEGTTEDKGRDVSLWAWFLSSVDIDLWPSPLGPRLFLANSLLSVWQLPLSF